MYFHKTEIRKLLCSVIGKYIGIFKNNSYRIIDSPFFKNDPHDKNRAVLSIDNVLLLLFFIVRPKPLKPLNPCSFMFGRHNRKVTPFRKTLISSALGTEHVSL